MQSICLVDGSWTVESPYSGYGWIWLDEMGNEKIMVLRNKKRCLSPLHLELDALIWYMENMIQHTTCQHYGKDCKQLIAMIKDLTAWPGFST